MPQAITAFVLWENHIPLIFLAMAPSHGLPPLAKEWPTSHLKPVPCSLAC